MTPAQKTSIARQVGQLLVIGFDGTSMTPALRAMLARIQPAGVILFGRNIVMRNRPISLLKDCQAAVKKENRLFTAVDLEGGRVDRFRNVTGPAPSAAEVFSTGERKLFRKHGQLIGKVCAALGFNLDFAPVLDLSFEASRKVMSSRAFSTDPEEVVFYAREFLAGLKSAGVIGAGKHFPGLGEGNLDSHHDLPVIKKNFCQALGRGPRALPKDAARAAHGAGQSRQLSRHHPRPAAGIAFKILDQRHAAKEARLPRSDRFRRSRDGRGAEGCAHRAGGGAICRRRRRPVPDLP